MPAMSNPKVSVVLPCYHVEQYLPGIHRDLVAQTVKDIEIIYINDGGGERLSNMIHAFAGADNRVVAVDKENGGVSSARNLGIETARGEWLVFVDPDDRLGPYYIESLLSTVEGTNNLLGIGGFKTEHLNQNRVSDNYLPRFSKQVKIKDVFPTWWDSLYCCVGNKIFKTDFLRRKGLRFPPYPIHEDALFICAVFDAIDTIGTVEYCGYRYLIYGNTAIQRYHKGFKELLKERRERYYALLRKYQVSERDVEAKKEKIIAFDVYWIVLNAFNFATPLSFAEKRAYIRDLMGDAYWMSPLEKHNWESESTPVKMAGRLLLTRKAWLVAGVFSALFAFKNTFKGGDYWCYAHFLRKWWSALSA